MKVFLPLFFSAILALLNGACGRETAAEDASPGKRSVIRSLLEACMPEAMRDGMVKIAVIVNLGEGDNARQFLYGCVSEGRSMGFIVDTFSSGADTAKIAKADYDGLVFAYADSYDILKPVADAGIPAVTFETFPQNDLDGLNRSFLDNELLARQSIAALIGNNRSNAIPPVRVIRIAGNPGKPFLDKRAEAFNNYVREGRIVEAAVITLNNTGNVYESAREELSALLPNIPLRSVDALWVPDETLAAACAEALAEAGRQDIKLASIGISNEVLRLMRLYPDVWQASAAVDPGIAGAVNMRILAARLAGEPLPEDFYFNPQLVKATDLNAGVNLANIRFTVPNWGDERGLLDHYQWMIDLKNANGNHLRIPQAAP